MAKINHLKQELLARQKVYKANMKYLRNEKFEYNAGRYEEVSQILEIIRKFYNE